MMDGELADHLHNTFQRSCHLAGNDAACASRQHDNAEQENQSDQIETRSILLNAAERFLNENNPGAVSRPGPVNDLTAIPLLRIVLEDRTITGTRRRNQGGRTQVL